jgi:hypothetical protein
MMKEPFLRNRLQLPNQKNSSIAAKSIGRAPAAASGLTGG